MRRSWMSDTALSICCQYKRMKLESISPAAAPPPAFLAASCLASRRARSMSPYSSTMYIRPSLENTCGQGTVVATCTWSQKDENLL